MIEVEEVRKNDYNLSPSRYVETADAETHRPIGHILWDLEQAQKEAARVDKDLAKIFDKLGLKPEAYDG